MTTSHDALRNALNQLHVDNKSHVFQPIIIFVLHQGFENFEFFLFVLLFRSA
jgi:hypothetical protein